MHRRLVVTKRFLRKLNFTKIPVRLIISTIIWAREMVHWVKALAVKPNNLSSTPGIHIWWKESTDSPKLSSDFHMQVSTNTHTCVHAHTHTHSGGQ